MLTCAFLLSILHILLMTYCTSCTPRLQLHFYTKLCHMMRMASLHEINSHEINSHEINLARDRDQLKFS